MEKLDINERIKLSAVAAEKSECNLVIDEGDPAEAADRSSDKEQSRAADSPQQLGAGGIIGGAVPTMPELGLPARYQVVEILGEGGMAHVYKALDSENGGEPIAIKILRPEIVPDPTIVERFFREAKAAQRLSHPSIVRVADYGTTDNKIPYLIMEYVAGRNLAQIISAEGHLTDARAVDIFMQIAEGLKDAHRLGMVHRDLKPSNILIATNDDGTESVKIADFGIAKPASSERWIDPDLTKTGAILGSPAYMSPEQCLGHVVDERSDIYSLGCLMYETLGGKSPFASDTPVKSMIRHLEEKPEPFEIEHSKLHISTGLEAITMKCLQKQPAKRYQTIKQLQVGLRCSLDPGIARRFCADAIDTAILLLSCTASVYLSRALLYSLHLHYLNSQSIWLALVFPFIFAVVIADVWAYCECSKWHATPGKRMTGLKIIDANGSVSGFLGLAMAAVVIAIIHVVGHLVLAFNLFWTALNTPAISWWMAYGVGLGAFALVGAVTFAPAFFNNGRRNFFELLTARTIVPADQDQASQSAEKRSTERLFVVAIVLLLFSTIMFQYSLSNQLLVLWLK